ncbi:MAG TPA: cupin domain-containing protein [Candidatus Baltobacteraceae bacterium]|jgi:mannose-6-phosphate isomerase-like protein (cupin superfamily)|nr:cupin domain-containing protein [Candidatus Baltobacteraceae bacterium]
MDIRQLAHEPYAEDLQPLALENTDFRRVLKTTERSQLVLMCVPSGGEIGAETHPGNDQILSFVQGSGHAVLENTRLSVSAGMVVVVPAGTRHNFVADSGDALKLFTIYAPPHHRPGTVHKTKADADADTLDAY